MDDEQETQPARSWWHDCGYEGYPQPALKPRPSNRKTLICPACLEEVK